MGPATTRCKFLCQSVTKQKKWTQAGEPIQFVYEAKFTAVYGDSPENKAFFDATPTGEIRIGVYKQDVFEPGKEYYIDITEAA